MDEKILTRKAAIEVKAKFKIQRQRESRKRERQNKISAWLMRKLIASNPHAAHFEEALAKVNRDASALEQKLMSEQQAEVTAEQIARADTRRAVKKQMRKR